MPTLCVILAAGDATRMPNKMMLATPSGKPVIESSVALACRSGFVPTIVIKPRSVVQQYIGMRARYVTQETATGVIDAIKLAYTGGDLYVLAGDNIYPDMELMRRDYSFAQVRRVMNDQLDGWVPRRWVSRRSSPEFKYAGYCFLKEPIKWGFDLIETFNLNDVRPISVPSDGWSDVGTEDTYKEMWE